MRLAAITAAALLALAACKPTPAPPGPRHAALTGGTFVRVEGDGYDQIYVLRPGATAWRLVGDTPKPPMAAGRYWKLAPDGVLGAYIVDGTLLYVQSVDGGPSHQIAAAPAGETICAPEWSADSTHLTYVVRTATATAAAGETFSVTADGTGRRVVPGANTDGACDRSIAAAGSATAFAMRGNLWVSVGVTLLPASYGLRVVGVLAVSPDATQAVVAASGGVYLVDVRGSAATPLPGVAPDGPVVFDRADHVLAVVGTAVQTFDLNGRLVTASPVVTTRPAATVSLVTWSP